MRESDYRINTYKRGRECLRHLAKDKNWAYWTAVIDALGEARREAFEIANTNRPVGSAYNRAFGAILEREKLQTTVLDSATRNYCLQLSEKWAKVEPWRATLPQNLKQTLNHPGAVWKRWKKANVVPEPKEHKPSIRDRVMEMEQELHAKDAYIKDLESGREFAAQRPVPAADGVGVCSFCALRSDAPQVTFMAATPNANRADGAQVYICNRCIGACVELMEGNRKSKAAELAKRKAELAENTQSS